VVRRDIDRWACIADKCTDDVRMPAQKDAWSCGYRMCAMIRMIAYAARAALMDAECCGDDILAIINREMDKKTFGETFISNTVCMQMLASSLDAASKCTAAAAAAESVDAASAEDSDVSLEERIANL
jgi:hypothetical protein